jgi:Holliday junction resolvase-like predicted endonuclease
MNTKQRNTPLPDVATVLPELTMAEKWDSAAVSDLIRSKSNNGETPAFLFLGKKESSMLKRHLAAAFGEESVVTLKSTYYMGLEVVAIDCDSFVMTGGRKTVRTLQDPIARRPQWRDAETESIWQFRI